MNLKSWQQAGWLRSHDVSKEEISTQLEVCDRHLQSARVEAVGTGWRLAIAYQAMLTVAAAALAVCGYRARSESHHYWLIQSLAITMHLEPDLVATLDYFRKARHQVLYDAYREITDSEVAEMIDISSKLKERLVVWLREEHPALLS